MTYYQTNVTMWSAVLHNTDQHVHQHSGKLLVLIFHICDISCLQVTSDIRVHLYNITTKKTSTKRSAMGTTLT